MLLFGVIDLVIICISVVVVKLLWLINVVFLLGWSVKLMLLRILMFLIDLEIFLIFIRLLLILWFGVNLMNGYLCDDGLILFNVIFFNCFFCEVVCLDFEVLVLNCVMNFCNFLIWLVFLVLVFVCNLVVNWLDFI